MSTVMEVVTVYADDGSVMARTVRTWAVVDGERSLLDSWTGG